ncbi:hypothetical protein [Castellaniella sp.]|uniref:hypothetical protein n=1 Tax=Castellaniella sp. TaxID=1955812 RepID=UPI002AFF5ED2|nr:hypothetical protein [Castellaniella sp.]
MAILKKTRKAARFVFVDMPLSVVGYRVLASNHQYIRDLWRSLRGISCPECRRGILVCQKDESVPDEKGEGTLHPWMCTACDFALLESSSSKKVRTVVRNMLNQETIERFGELEFAARQKRARQYAIHSRVFFTLAAGLFGYFLYNLAIGVGLAFSLNLASAGLACAAVALKASYRSWQVDTGTLFVQGSFFHFLKHERWLR